MRRLLIGLLLFPIFSFADHEPPEYSFAAKRGNLPTRNLAIFAPSSDPRPISQSSYQDQFISSKLDDLLLGEPKVGLAALAISKGQLVYQRYLRDVEDNLYPSWSIAKSIASLTVGYALCDGKIASLNDKAELYAEVLKNTPWGEARIIDLLTMSSGASITDLDLSTGDYRYQSSGLIYSISRDRMTLKRSFRVVGNDNKRTLPGGPFFYNNQDTEALGSVIASATGESFQDYFSRRVWSQIQPEHRAIWALDREKQAIVSAYFFASIRDYARLAMHIIDLYKGRSGNDCLKNYVREAITPKKHVRGTFWYGYQFWIYGARAEMFAMSGHQGQEIIINPEREKILVLAAYHSSIREKYRDPQNLIPWLRRD